MFLTNFATIFRLSLVIVLLPCFLDAYVLCHLYGRLGNNLFQLAAAKSLALDHNTELICPDLANKNSPIYCDYHKRILFRVSAKKPLHKPASLFHYREFKYQKIPYTSDMALKGFFFSDKYFKHHKKEIVDLFAPSKEIKRYLHKKHQKILSHPNTVALHVRCYYPYCKDPKSTDGKGIIPFLGFDYFKEAMRGYPEDALFVVFSDNIPLCRRKLGRYRKNMIYVEGEPYYHDFYLMSFCKHQVISNSTFSWWAAYLNNNPKKRVTCPKHWVNPTHKNRVHDISPEGWIIQDNTSNMLKR